MDGPCDEAGHEQDAGDYGELEPPRPGVRSHVRKYGRIQLGSWARTAAWVMTPAVSLSRVRSSTARMVRPRATLGLVLGGFRGAMGPHGNAWDTPCRGSSPYRVAVAARVSPERSGTPACRPGLLGTAPANARRVTPGYTGFSLSGGARHAGRCASADPPLGPRG